MQFPEGIAFLDYASKAGREGKQTTEAQNKTKQSPPPLPKYLADGPKERRWLDGQMSR